MNAEHADPRGGPSQPKAPWLDLKDPCPSGGPEWIGEFRIVREIGRGGMGIVLEAWQESLERGVALKVLPPSLLSQPKTVARFRREAQIAARLDHDNIVKVHGIGVESGVPYFVMELVHGKTLRQIDLRGELREDASDLPTESAPVLPTSTAMAPNGAGDASEASDPSEALECSESPLSLEALSVSDEEMAMALDTVWATGVMPESPRDPDSTSISASAKAALSTCRRVADLFAGVADGLHHAHRMGVVHRDLKPSNVILDTHSPDRSQGTPTDAEPGGRLRILDFSLARLEGQTHLTMTDEILGTPLYMSPEQARGARDEIGPGTDIYGLGATLYEALTGQPPIQGRTRQAVLNEIIQREPRPLRSIDPKIPRDIDTIVLKCLRKNPRNRYATAEALGQDLRRFARGDPVEARTQSFFERLTHRLRRHGRRAAVALTFLVLLTSTAVLAIRQHRIEYLRSLELYTPLVRASVVKIQRGLLGRRVHGGDPRTGTYRNGLFTPNVMLYASRAGYFERLRNVERTPLREQLRESSFDPLIEAVSDLSRATTILPDRPDARYHRAWGLLLLGRDDEALVELDATHAGFAPARALRALILKRRGDPEGARRELEVAESSTDGHWATVWLEAYRATMDRDWPGAIEAFDELHRIEGHREFYIGSSIETLLGRGVAKLESGKVGGAIMDFAMAGGRWPGALEPGLLLGKALLLNDRTEEAQQHFLDLHLRSSGKDRAALGIALVHGSLDLHDEGLAWAHQIVDPQLRHRTIAAFLLHDGNWVGARDAAEEALAVSDRDAEAYLYKGVALLSLDEDLSRAIDALRQATALRPEQPIAHIWLGDALARAGDLESAFKAYEKASRLDPTNPWIYISRGVTLLRQSRRVESFAEFRRAFELAPTLSSTYLHLDDLFRWQDQSHLDFGAELGRFVTAVEAALEDTADHPLFPDLLRILGRMLLQSEDTTDHERAHAYALLAVEKTQRLEAETLALLADVEFALERGAEAVRTLEEAVALPHAGSALPEVLESYRRAIFPRVVSYASADATLDRFDTEVLVPEGETWRYFPGRESPAEGLLWTTIEFDDSAWPSGPSGFGYGDGDDRTEIADMSGQYPSIYVRRTFEVLEPEQVLSLRLVVRVDDGCVGYLNGEQICRLGVAGAREPVASNGLATTTVAWEPLPPIEIKISPRLLRPGRNTLAFQGLNASLGSSDLSLIPVLLARRSPDSARDARLLEQLSGASVAGDSRPYRRYLEGRFLHRLGRHEDAAPAFEELVQQDASQAEPLIRLVESLRALGRHAEAAGRLAMALGQGTVSDRKAWDLWARLVLVDLARPPAELLVEDPLALVESGPGADLRWLVERLRDGGPIAINCGGLAHVGADGAGWGRDRFFAGGYIYGGRSWDLIRTTADSRYHADIAMTEDDVLYQTERWFPAEEVRRVAYRIPLPDGEWLVRLHFAEVYLTEPGQRLFDVILEDELVLEAHDTVLAGTATANCEPFHVRVLDGFLDLEFTPRVEHPKISAIEIHPADSAASSGDPESQNPIQPERQW